MKINDPLTRHTCSKAAGMESIYIYRIYRIIYIMKKIGEVHHVKILHENELLKQWNNELDKFKKNPAYKNINSYSH